MKHIPICGLFVVLLCAVSSADANKQNLSLARAAFDNDLEGVQNLLQNQDISINARVKLLEAEEALPALGWAIKSDDLRIVQLLLRQENILPCAPAPKTGATALHLAALTNNTQIVKHLLAHPAMHCINKKTYIFERPIGSFRYSGCRAAGIAHKVEFWGRARRLIEAADGIGMWVGRRYRGCTIVKYKSQ